MAIKGKKKPQSRGSAARRRPAAPPRLAYVRQVRVPWYRTPGGRVAAAVGLVLLITAVAVGTTTVTSNRNEASARRERIDSYTSSIRTLMGEVVKPASALAEFPPKPDDRVLKGLEEHSKEWYKALTSAGGSARKLKAPSGLEGLNALFFESIRLYSISASTYEVAASADGATRQGILERAKEQTDAATSVWTDAVYLLDQARDDAGLSASEIVSPPLAGATP
jgi:hypothetical protein